MPTTLTQLRTQARQRADMVNSTFITDSELNDYINLEYAELYDLLVSTYEDWYMSSQSFTIPSGNAWPLPEDFYKLRGLDLNTEGSYINVPQFNFQERNFYTSRYIRATSGLTDLRYRVVGNELLFYPEDRASSNSFRLWYIPRYTPMQAATAATLLQNNLQLTAVTAGDGGNLISLTLVPGGSAGSEAVSVTGNDITVQIANGLSTTAAVQLAIAANSAAAALVTPSVVGTGNTPQVSAPQAFLSGGTADGTADGVNGWEEIIVLGAAIKMLGKEESDANVLIGQKERMVGRIKVMAADRDAANPERVTDVYVQNWLPGMDSVSY